MKSFALFLGTLCVLYFCGACGSSSSGGDTPGETCPTLNLAGFYATTSAPYVGSENPSITGNLITEDAWSFFFNFDESGSAEVVVYIPGTSSQPGETISGTWTTTGTNIIKGTFGDFVVEGTLSQDSSTCIVTSNFDMVDGSVVHISNDEPVVASFHTNQYPHDLTPTDLAGAWRQDVLTLYNNAMPSQTIDELGNFHPELTINADGSLTFNDGETTQSGTITITNNYLVNLAGSTGDVMTLDLVNNNFILNTYDAEGNFGSGDVSATAYRLFNKI